MSINLARFLGRLPSACAVELSPWFVPKLGQLTGTALSLLGGACFNGTDRSAATSRILTNAFLGSVNSDDSEPVRSNGRQRYSQRNSKYWTKISDSWNDCLPGIPPKTAVRRQIASKMRLVRAVRAMFAVLTLGGLATGGLIAANVLTLGGGTWALIGLGAATVYALGGFISTFALANHYQMDQFSRVPRMTEDTDDLDLNSPLHRSASSVKWGFIGSCLIWPLALIGLESDESKQQEFEMWERRIHG